VNAEFGSTGENDRTGDGGGRGPLWIGGLLILVVVVVVIILANQG